MSINNISKSEKETNKGCQKLDSGISDDDKDSHNIEPIPEKNKNFNIDIIPHIIRNINSNKAIAEDITSCTSK